MKYYKYTYKGNVGIFKIKTPYQFNGTSQYYAIKYDPEIYITPTILHKWIPSWDTILLLREIKKHPEHFEKLSEKEVFLYLL